MKGETPAYTPIIIQHSAIKVHMNPRSLAATVDAKTKCLKSVDYSHSTTSQIYQVHKTSYLSNITSLLKHTKRIDQSNTEENITQSHANIFQHLS